MEQLRALLRELEEAGRENDTQQQDRHNKMLNLEHIVIPIGKGLSVAYKSYYY